MEYENFWDRLTYRLRPVIIAGLWLAVPVFLVSYAGMFARAVIGMPWYFGIPVVIAHLVAWLGIASLFDIQQERLESQKDARSERHPPI